MKKGFTLIETLISAALIGTIIAYEAMIFGKYIIIHKKIINQQETERYVEEAFGFIENELENCSNIRITENTLILVSSEDANEESIKLKVENSLVIEYLYNSGKYYNVIANYIKDFGVFIHGKVLYLSLTDTNGKKYERCYGLKFIK